MAPPFKLLKNTYKNVAASQTAQVLGTTGAVGDALDKIVIVPETTGAGTIALLDGTTPRTSL